MTNDDTKHHMQIVRYNIMKGPALVNTDVANHETIFPKHCYVITKIHYDLIFKN